MLNKLKQRKESGFTIIEVMIVLAIAGLILLIVFLAVPALQRNSRNTNRKSDVAAISAAISEYVTNNSGIDPNTCSGTSAITFNNTTAGTTSEAKVGYYQAGCGAAVTATAGAIGMSSATIPTAGIAAPSATASNDYVNIYIGGACDGTTAGKVDPGSARSVAVQYQLEVGTGKYAGACQSS